MVDYAGLSSVKSRQSFSEAEAWISSTIGGARSITVEEIEELYHKRDVACGWRFPLELEQTRVELDLLLPSQFPWRPPRIAAVDRSLFLKIPHVESDGILCVLQDHTEVSQSNPVDIIKRVLFLAGQLLTDGLSGKNRHDFQLEFRSYWPDDPGAKTIHSLLKPSGRSRYIDMWRGKQFSVVGESAESVLQWMQNRFDNGKKHERTTTKALYVGLDQALFPDEFPTDARSVLAVAERHAPDSVDILMEAAAGHPDEVVIVLGADTINGPALGAITLKPPQMEYRGPGRTRVDKLTTGFRPGKIPKTVIAKRMLGGQSILRSRVNRIDPAWIHGRGADSRQEALSRKSVAMVGCGSVGAAVANLLAQAGVGRLVLIDPDTLSWANVGRHLLGAPGVGRCKSDELARSLLSNYPHMKDVVSRSSTWQDVAYNSPDLLNENDLIISTVGSWSDEGALNDWHLSSGIGIPIVYGWTEAHAAAGHAVAILPSGGCLACGMSSFGVPKLRVSEWSSGVSRLQEPSCGAVYQPYGPVELAHVNALVANLGLHVLLEPLENSKHVIWSAPYSILKTHGGNWTPEWQTIAGERKMGGFLEECRWPQAFNCLSCREANK